MTSLLINPTLEQVNAELARLCAVANHSQRSRTAELEISVTEWALPSALLRNGGDGVCNSYRQAATTTVVGCAWHEENGTRIVRLEASRTYAPKSSRAVREAFPFGFNTAATFWAKAVARVVATSAPELRDLTNQLEPSFAAFGETCNLFDPATLEIIADWLQDRDLPNAAVREWVKRFAPVAV